MDEEGIEPKDIELVVSQVNCSRAKAVEALRCLVAVSLCCGQPRRRNREPLLYIHVWAPIGVWHMLASGANKNDIVEARSKADHKLIFCMNVSRVFDASVFLVIRWPSVWLDTSSLRPSCSSPPAKKYDRCAQVWKDKK